MDEKLDIIIEVQYIKHLCEAYQDEGDKAKKEEIWRVLIIIVEYLSKAIVNI